MRAAVLLLLVGTFAATGCQCGVQAVDTALNIETQKALASPRIAEFYERMARGECQSIYDAAAPEFRTQGTVEKWTGLCEAVRRKLGTVSRAEPRGWRVNRIFGRGRQLILTYQTTYTEGTAMETFVFKIEDKSASLLAWHVQSDALILK